MSSEPVILDAVAMTNGQIVDVAEARDDSFQAQRRLYLVRPSTEVGPDGLTDEQIKQMAEAMANALWREHKDKSRSLSDDR